MKRISCKEAVELILKKEEGRITFFQRISLSRHLLICSLCRIFSLQNSHINSAMSRKGADQLTLSAEDKEKIIRKVLDDDGVK
ncbi:hypothetical protein WBG78_08075 [Chryseolinea sp. T2]|uniref:hypothetical protein n=1 Tax=Chryseolinea sp. T2 TaxID=3129255 RepID=UPI0030789A13